MQNDIMTPGDLWLMVKRRKWSLVLIFTAVMSATLAVAILMPAIYQSYALIMVEEQHIPSDFVMTTVSTYAEQRVENIKQRALSYTQLSDIIIEYNLYPDLRKNHSLEDVVERMRNAINVSMKVSNRGFKSPQTGTTSFTLSYEGKDRRSVLEVTNKLTTLFLQQNLEVRQQQIQETSRFLSEEVSRIEEELKEIEGRVSAFRKEHINELPELFQLNVQGLAAAETNIERLNSELHILKQQKNYFRSQLVNMALLAQEEVLPRNIKIDTIKELKLQLSSLRQRYTDEYPDISVLNNQIIELEQQVATEDLSKAQVESTGNIDMASSVRISELKTNGIDSTNNPAYVTLSSQLASTEANIGAIQIQINSYAKQVSEYRRRIEATPKVEESYLSMVNHRNASLAKYNDLLQKHQEARVAQELEKDQKGERFTLLEPARLPVKPYKPNRRLIVLIGMILAIGTSIGYAALREQTDQTVRSTDSLAQIVQAPVLAGVPQIITPSEQFQKRLIMLFSCLLVLVLIGGSVAAFHYYIMDLDIFWVKVARQFDTLFL